MSTDNENAVALVKRGYDEPTRCLSFRVAFYCDPPNALAAIRAVGRYNDYDGERVARALEGFLVADVVQRISVGREGSPVLYLNVYDSAQRPAVEAALAAAQAGELGWTDGTLRAWWD